jgi:hypothetical protein
VLLGNSLAAADDSDDGAWIMEALVGFSPVVLRGE